MIEFIIVVCVGVGYFFLEYWDDLGLGKYDDERDEMERWIEDREVEWREFCWLEERIVWEMEESENVSLSEYEWVVRMMRERSW